MDGQVLDYEYFGWLLDLYQEEAMEALRYFTGTEGLAVVQNILHMLLLEYLIDIIAANEHGIRMVQQKYYQMPTAPSNTENYILTNPEYWADNG